MPADFDKRIRSNSQDAENAISRLFWATVALAIACDQDGNFDALWIALEGMPEWVAKPLAKAVSDHLRDLDLDLWARAACALTPAANRDDKARAKPWCPLGGNALPPAQQKWLTKFLAPTASDMVSQAASGAISEKDARRELDDAAIGIAWHEGWPAEMGQMAADAAWQHATERFARFRAKLRARIWPMGQAHEPGTSIMMAAREINDEFGWLLPTPLMEDAAKRIARTAAKPKPRRARHGQ